MPTRYAQPAPDTYQTSSVEVDLNGQTKAVVQAAVDRTFFQAAGVAPLVGRGFIDGDYNAQTRVAVLSEPLWRGSLGADPAAIGKQLKINGNVLTIVGIMPSGFEVPSSVGVWIPRRASN
jgi:putative ABC transport system permease protein